MKTAELDASKSDLRASINSSNLDLSSNHPEFKRRISRDTSIERQDKSKALFGQIGMISTLSHKKILEASSRSASFLTEQNYENKSVSYMNSSAIDGKQMQPTDSKRDKRIRSKFSKDKSQYQIDVQQLNTDATDANELLRSQAAKSVPQQAQDRERGNEQVNKESLEEINVALEQVQQMREDQMTHDEQMAKAQPVHTKGDFQKTERLDGMDSSNNQFNLSSSAK